MKNRFMILSLCFVFVMPTQVFAGVSWKNLNLSATQFPESTQYYKTSAVREDSAAPGFLIFTVSNDEVKMPIEGLYNLKKFIHESEVLAKLNAGDDAAGGVAEGAMESVKGTGRGLKNLVFHPVQSVKGLGTAAGRMTDKVGDAFREKEEGEKGDSFLSSTKRQIAKKLGVDVYTRDEFMQDKLTTLAKQQMGGRGIVMVASFFIPFGLVASAVMTASNINNAADELVNDSDRIDLYKMNKEALLRMGIEEEKAVALLNNSYYTPREITYIRFYLDQLKSLHGFKALADQAAGLTEPVPAQKFLHEMQIAADAARGKEKADAIDIVPEGLLIETGDAVALICGYDYLDSSALGNRVIEKTKEYKTRLKKSKASIWNAGVVTPAFDGSLLLTGIKTHRMCLFKNVADEVNMPA